MASSSVILEDNLNPHNDCDPEGHHQTKPQSQITPLPKVQLGILLALFISESITSTVIYPFINQLLNEFGITHGDQRKTGYYVGLIESIFFLTESLLTLQWGRLSDAIGRKPVLLTGVSGLALSMVSFGFSKTFPSLVISRAVAGALNGNIGVVKSMLGEITDDSNMPQAFVFLSICWAGGSTIGPLLGGFLSRPSERFPQIFRSQVWRDYPYLLPCLAAAAYSVFVFVLVFVLLRETLNVPSSHREIPDSEAAVSLQVSRKSSIDAPGPETPLLSAQIPTVSPQPPLLSVISPRVSTSILNYSLLSLIDIAFIALQPLILSTPISAGGLGLPPATIGFVLGIIGLLNGIIQIMWFPWMCRKMGTRKLYRVAVLSMIGGVGAFPVMNWVANGWGVGVGVWLLMVIQFPIIVLDGMAFACVSMYVSASAPTRNSLGAVNGLGQTATSFMRAVGPASATSFFAISVENNLLGGNLVYLVLMLLSVLAYVVARLLPEEPWRRGTGDGR